MKGINKVATIEEWLEYRRLNIADFEEEINVSNLTPVIPHNWDSREIQWWFFKGFCYRVDRSKLLGYSQEQIQLLIFDDYDKERRKIERLKKKFELDDDEKYGISRPRIP